MGRDRAKLQEVKQQVESNGCVVEIDTRLGAARKADIVLTVTSSLEPVIKAEHLKPGAVACDVARPRNVSLCVAKRRDDVLVIEGGVVDLPGRADFGFDFGFPPGTAYACMAETAVLALEGRFECYTLGRNISLDRVDEIAQLAARHGVRLSGFRSFERALRDDEVKKVRERARMARMQDDSMDPDSLYSMTEIEGGGGQG
jgi:predicted amino acid dehydrogenase